MLSVVIDKHRDISSEALTIVTCPFVYAVNIVHILHSARGSLYIDGKCYCVQIVRYFRRIFLAISCFLFRARRAMLLCIV